MQPIILAHGFIGYRKFMLWSMFGGVADALRKEGYTVFQPVVHPTATIEERAEQHAGFIQKELGSGEKFHWIGHSMGGLDGRYTASPGGLNLGHRFLTLTTLSTPHQGSPLPDRIPRWFRVALSTTARFSRIFFQGEQKQFLNNLSECRWDGLDQLTPEYIGNQFNPKIMDHPRVRYYSYAGLVDFSRVTFSNLIRQPAWRYMRKKTGPNDGMVGVESSKWGEYKGTQPADHGGLIGLQIIPWSQPDFDHIRFFLRIAKELEEIENGINIP